MSPVLLARKISSGENSSFREFCSQGLALGVHDQPDNPHTCNSSEGNVGRMMRLGTCLKSCFCPPHSTKGGWSGQWSWWNGQHPGLFIKDVPRGASSAHLFLKTNHPEGTGEGGRITSFVCQTDFHQKMGLYVKGEVDNEEPRAKTLDHEGKYSMEVKDEHLKYFCFAEMQRKEKKSLRLIPTQLPSVQNALWGLSAVSIFQIFPTFALKEIQVVSYLFLLERALQRWIKRELCALCTELDFSGCIFTLGV